MTVHVHRFAIVGAFMALLGSGAAFSQLPTPSPIQAILQAHRAWANPPNSIQIVGNVLKRDVKEPVTIIANRTEETRMDFGGTRWVATPTRHFQDDGAKLKLAQAPSGFAQLDVTSVFFLAHLGQRAVNVGPLEPVSVKDQALVKIHVRGNRSEKHYSRIVVNDAVDIYVHPSGLLAGVSRSFYENNPPFNYTMSLAFSDYRNTAGVLLPYRIERFINGMSVETIAVDSYAFEVPTPASLFEMPRRPR